MIQWMKPGTIAAWGVAGAALMLAVPAISQDAPKPPDEAAERKALEGTWEGWVLDGRGARTDRGPVRLAKLVIKGDQITATDGMLDLGTGTYKLDVTQNPRRLDAKGTDGQPKGYDFPGIYSLEGDTLRWCAANPGRPRPTEFFTKSAVQFYMYLKRVKPEAPAEK